MIGVPVRVRLSSGRSAIAYSLDEALCLSVGARGVRLGEAVFEMSQAQGFAERQSL